MDRPGSGAERWFDQEAGPVVRPYALTRGRARPSGATLDLIDVVLAVGQLTTEIRWLSPEHRQLVTLCSQPMTVADLASDTDLPLGVVRVLLGDLRQQGLISIIKAPRGDRPTPNVLQSVLDRLRAL